MVEMGNLFSLQNMSKFILKCLKLENPSALRLPFIKHQRTHKIEKCTYTVNVGLPSSGSLSSLKMREFTEGRNSMVVVHVGRHIPQSLDSLSTRKFIHKRNLI